MEIKDNILIIYIDKKIESPEFVSLNKLKEFIGNNKLKAIIITGKGRGFSSGGNLDKIKNQNSTEIKNDIENGYKLVEYLKNLNIPIIAAIRGICFGAGLEIVLNCDIKIAAKNALFAFPESNHGIIPGFGGTQLLPAILNKKETYEIILKADMFDSDKAHRLKIIDEIYQGKEILDYTINYARSITQNKPLRVIKAVTESIRNSEMLPLEESIKKETALFCKLAASIDE